MPAAPVAAEHLRARQSERRNRQSQRAGQQRAVGKKFVEVGRGWVIVRIANQERELRTLVGEHGEARAGAEGVPLERHRNMVAAGVPCSDRPAAPSDLNPAYVFQPTGGRHTASIPAGRSSSGAAAGGGSPQSIAGCSASSSRHSSGVSRSGSGDRPVAASKIAGRYDRTGLLPGRVAEQRSSPHPRAFYWRGVVNWQYVVDLDDSGVNFPSWVDP